jgi:hypothetical protein
MGDKPMLDEKTARSLILCGVAAAVISGAITLVMSILGAQGIGLLALVDVAVFFGLAYGIYRGNRIAAIAALAWWLVERVYIYALSASLFVAFGPVILILTAGYAIAIVGTFKSAPAAAPSVRSTGGAPSQRPLRPAPKPKTALNPAREFCAACNGTGKVIGVEAACAWCNGAGYI